MGRLIRSLALIMLIFLFLPNESLSQTTYPKNYFSSPVDIPLRLAANFAEIRPNHFHAGIDIETEQKEGLNVRAAADGFVSRIKVSATGYGNALYITHPNGYTTVYGHLQRYNDAIAQYVKKNQYEKEAFEVDLFPTPELFPVNKGDIVALSGNTGGSEGPHLHFEIRDTKTEEPVNPLLFGFDIKDHIAPVISALKMFPLHHSGTINYKAIPQRFALQQSTSNSFQLLDNTVVSVSGNIGIAIEGFDKEDGNDERFTIYSLELLMDGKSLFNATINRFAFAEQRYVNAHIDYEQMKKTNEHFLKLFKAPNDLFSAYKASGSGIINLNDTMIHYLKIIAKDVYGNTSELNLKVKSHPKNSIPMEGLKTIPNQKVFPYQQVNSYLTDAIKITFPEGTLYDTLFFTYTATKATPKTYSSIHHIHNIYIPVHASYSLAIKASEMPLALQDKATLVRLDGSGNPSAIKSSYKDGFVIGNPSILGDFAVMADTVKPIIKFLTDLGRTDKTKPFLLQFKITDNLSGIKLVRATLNGHWILMMEDAKTQTFSCLIESPTDFIAKDFLLEAIDNKCNKETFHLPKTR